MTAMTASAVDRTPLDDYADNYDLMMKNSSMNSGYGRTTTHTQAARQRVVYSSGPVTPRPPGQAFHPDYMFCGTCTECKVPPNNGSSNSSTGSGRILDDSSSDRDPILTHRRQSKDDEYDGEDHDNDNGMSSPSWTPHDRVFDDTATNNKNNDDEEDSTRLKTQLRMQHHWKSPHHKLVLESLLQPVQGVIFVEVNLHDASVGAGDGNVTTVTVHHDASTRDAELLRILKQGGYPANIVERSYMEPAPPAAAPEAPPSYADPAARDDTGRGWVEPFDEPHGQPKVKPLPTVVRSTFFVQGICCASELPSIRKIVKPIPGVVSLQINITTRRVYVQYHPRQCRAGDIADALTHAGFPAQVLQNGESAAADALGSLFASSSTKSATVGRSTLQAHRVLHPQDVGKIQRVLMGVYGVKRVGINVADSVVFAEHDVHKVTAVEIQQALAQHRHTADCQFAIVQDAQVILAKERDALVHQPRSLFVESCFQVSNLTHKHVPLMYKVWQQHYIKAQVRAVHPHPHSRTVKIEHNPDKVSAQQVADVLYKYGLHATVVTDGGTERHFLPLRSGGSTSAEQEEDELAAQRAMAEWQHNTLQLHVILSGIFWVVSMFAAVQGLDTLEYAGLLSVMFGLPPVAQKAWRTVQRCEFDANCMMVVAAVGALLLGQMDEAASVSFLFAVSEYLESRATERARQALSQICQLRPDHANLLIHEWQPKQPGDDDDDNNDNEDDPNKGKTLKQEVVIVPAEKVPVGSLISVRTGDKIAADGIVIEGTSLVDESSLTGESVPARKTVGSTVSGGSINIGTTQLVIRTTSTVEDSTVSRLIRLIEEAQANRSPTEKMIDAFARAYTPIVLVMALLMAVVPWFVGGLDLGRHWTMNALIIIVIACPCALTISTPVTYAAGLAAAAQRGVVVKGGASLEALGCVDQIVLDKTGTLTEGKFAVVHLDLVVDNPARYTRKEMLELLALMEGPSSHPLSSTLVRAAKNEGVTVPANVSVTDHTILKGEGVTALIRGKATFVGNRKLFERIGMYEELGITYQDRAAEWSMEGGTVGFLGVEGEGIIGLFCMTDSVRPEARWTVHTLQRRGMEVSMLTGDGEGAAKAVALQVGLPEHAVHSSLLPEDKLHHVGSLKRPAPKSIFSLGLFRRHPRVLYCGDGVNDGPALAAADVGVSMGEGAALAMEISDVTLMDSNLEKLVYIVNMGSRVRRTIQENIVLSLGCKLAVVALTFAGKMTLLYAIATDVGVMLIVTLNGMKLLPGVQDNDENGSSSRDKALDMDYNNSNSSIYFNERFPLNVEGGDNDKSSNLTEEEDDIDAHVDDLTRMTSAEIV